MLLRVGVLKITQKDYQTTSSSAAAEVLATLYLGL
jgi:hypothetical protein